DPAWGSAFGWDELSAVTDDIERTLNIGPTEPSVAGANNELLAIGAQRLGLEHRPIERNVNGCEGLGRCLQVCPNGHKMSMDRTYLSRAAALGARILTGARVIRVASNRVEFVDVTSQTRQVVSARAVVVAASAVQTPALLLRSGAKHRGIGRGFMAHPGASMAGRFAQEVDVWTGATQGHEVIGLRKQGIKFEALGFDLAIGASRFKSVGQALTRDIEDMGHWAHWGAAIRAQSQGRVRPTRIFGGSSSVSVTYELGPADMAKVRRGVAVLGEMMLAAGADFVTPGVHGFDEKVDDPARMRMLDANGPLDPRAYAMVLTHMFSTCRMGSSPDQPVALDFSVRGLPGVYVADSSVFPSNTGVNPQTSIIAMATLCGRRLVV
ncbi:MAG: GMC family oxidoreductase N-terminal domain-containing protein, partial [bacterium]